MNRIGIFLTYDTDSIVDEYIEYMLNDLSNVIDKIIIVSNGPLSKEGRKVFEKYSNDILVRENKGFDFGAWKDTIISHIGFEQLKEYDELVLLNDSFFGPFESFEKVFHTMEQQKLDFWGLSVHGEVETVRDMCPYGYRPRYIQTYFVVFGKKILQDYSFYKYWTDMEYYSAFLEVGEKCSAVLTKYFSDLGFSWGVYSDTTEFESTYEKNICHHAFNLEYLISEKEYPIIKRKSFVLGKRRFLKYNTGMDLLKAIEYIHSNETYDLDLAYNHIVRRFNIYDLKETLNLDYVLPTDYTLEDTVKNLPVAI